MNDDVNSEENLRAEPFKRPTHSASLFLHTCAPETWIFNEFYTNSFAATKKVLDWLIVNATPTLFPQLLGSVVSATQKLIKIFFKNLICRTAVVGIHETWCECVCGAKTAREIFYDGLDWHGKVSWIHTKAIKMPFTPSRSLLVLAHIATEMGTTWIYLQTSICSLDDPFSVPSWSGHKQPHGILKRFEADAVFARLPRLVCC